MAVDTFHYTDLYDGRRHALRKQAYHSSSQVKLRMLFMEIACKYFFMKSICKILHQNYCFGLFCLQWFVGFFLLTHAWIIYDEGMHLPSLVFLCYQQRCQRDEFIQYGWVKHICVIMLVLNHLSFPIMTSLLLGTKQSSKPMLDHGRFDLYYK